jgi:molybdopterin converting factor small subunit
VAGLVKVRVLLFADLAEAAGSREILVDLPVAAGEPGPTAGRVLDAVATRIPAAADRLAHAALAVDDRYVARTRPLTEGEIVAVIPPVSGG